MFLLSRRLETDAKVSHVQKIRSIAAPHGGTTIAMSSAKAWTRYSGCRRIMIRSRLTDAKGKNSGESGRLCLIPTSRGTCLCRIPPSTKVTAIWWYNDPRTAMARSGEPAARASSLK